MPHTSRKLSESGYYHVVPKGVNGRLIFENDIDRNAYVSLLSEASADFSILLHAYCLMSNHVHLVLEDAQGELADYMKLIHERYGTYFSDKIECVDGVFRKPFWSEPIETDEYLLCAVRYVHANPAAAGICPASAYDWSSAKDYLGRSGIAHTEMVLDMCGGVDGFVRFSQPGESTALPFPGSQLRGHLNDDEAARISHAVMGGNCDLTSADRAARSTAIAVLIKRGFGVSQISRVTGLGRGEIYRHMKSCDTRG